MPSVPCANTHLTTVMIAERMVGPSSKETLNVADSLQDQLRKGWAVNEKKLQKSSARAACAAEMERKAHGAADDDPALVAQRARAEKSARDRALNEERDRQTRTESARSHRSGN